MFLGVVYLNSGPPVFPYMYSTLYGTHSVVSFHNATVQPRVFANSDFEEVLSQLVEVKKVKFSVLDMQYMNSLKVANNFRYAE